MKKRRILNVCLIGVMSGGLCKPLWGEGFRGPPEGAAALRRIGGRIAYTEDASAVSHNPANLVELRAPSMYASGTLGYTRTEYEGPEGGAARSADPWYVIPALYGSRPVGDPERGRVMGLGLSSPYGRHSRLDEEGPFRFVAPYYTELISVALTPVLATPVSDTVSMGVGVNLLWSELDIRQMYPWSVVTGDPRTPDGKTYFSGDGMGAGAVAAVTWQPNERHRLAFTWRSPIRVKYEGDVRFTERPEGAPGREKSDFETEITFPLVLGFGYGVEVTDRLLVEANVEWVRHSSFDRLKLDAGENAPLLPEDEMDMGWSDNWTFGVSAEWKVSEAWRVSAGAVYLESPVPDRTMLPTTAERDQGVISVGGRYIGERMFVDAAYSLGVFSTREVRDSDTPAFDGKYDFESHLVSLACGVNF